MKPTLLLGMLISALLLAGLATRNGVLLALAVPLLAGLAVGLFFAPPPPDLHITRRQSADRVNPGQPVTVTLTVANRGARLDELVLADTLPAGLTPVDGQTRWFITLDAGQSTTLEYTVHGTRGLHHFSTVRATAREPLGLFSQHTKISAPGQIFVMPQSARVRRVSIRPPRTGIYAGQIPARQGGPGVEFFGVRPYQPGDPLRRVNARAGARFPSQLFVNEFEQERVVDVGLILDAREQANVTRPGQHLFEYSVQAAATLADTFLNGGNRVGLFIYGRSLDWTIPGYGKQQRERIMRALARAALGGGSVFEKLDRLPTRLFPVRSQLVLVSPLLPQDAEMLVKLRARGYRLLVISPDPVQFEADALPDTATVQLAVRLARLERNLILDQLRRAQIQVVDWPVTVPFYQLAHVALSRPPLLRTGGLAR